MTKEEMEVNEIFIKYIFKPENKNGRFILEKILLRPEWWRAVKLAANNVIFFKSFINLRVLHSYAII